MPKKIFIGGLSAQTSSRELEELFKDVDGFVSLRMSTSTDGSRIGYAEMESDRDAETAVKKLNGKELHGQTISVRLDGERDERR